MTAAARRLTRFAAGLRLEDIPAPVVRAAKFRANAARALPPPSVERLTESILSLDRMETPAPMTTILRQSER